MVINKNEKSKYQQITFSTEKRPLNNNDSISTHIGYTIITLS